MECFQGERSHHQPRVVLHFLGRGKKRFPPLSFLLLRPTSLPLFHYDFNFWVLYFRNRNGWEVWVSCFWWVSYFYVKKITLFSSSFLTYMLIQESKRLGGVGKLFLVGFLFLCKKNFTLFSSSFLTDMSIQDISHALQICYNYFIFIFNFLHFCFLGYNGFLDVFHLRNQDVFYKQQEVMGKCLFSSIFFYD